MTLTANLNGKRALVTGASSQGLGRYFASKLAGSGAEAIVTARREPQLADLVAEISAAGGSAVAVGLDVTDHEAVCEFVSLHGPFDIVVNNAGIDIARPLLEQTAGDFDQVMSVNLRGTWSVSLEAARALRAVGRPGSIINIASVTGIRQVERITPYAVSKAAVIQLTKQMALELAPFEIRVNAIAPGYFQTDLTRDYFSTDRGKALLSRIPMQRSGDYCSLGAALLFLASDDASFVTGSVITVDGGHAVSGL